MDSFQFHTHTHTQNPQLFKNFEPIYITTIGIVDENVNATRIKGYLLLAFPPKDKSNWERKHPSRPGRDDQAQRGEAAPLSAPQGAAVPIS